MALEGFNVARALTSHAGSSSSAYAVPGWGPAAPGQIGPFPGVEVHVGLIYYPENPLTVDRWDAALWDTGTWETPATSQILDDISCDVVSYAANLGRDEPLGRFRTGTATVTVDDPTGKYSPWRSGTASAIQAGIELVVWVEIGATSYPRFRGLVRAIRDTFPDTEGAHQVEFECADFCSILAAYDGIERAPEGDGELSGARLTRICDVAGYDRPRVFDVGTVPLQATTLAKNTLDEAGNVCDTELGVLYCTPDGTLVHRDRSGMLTDPRFATVQATFGEVDPELCYLTITPACDTETIRNVVSIAAEGGTASTREDGTSIAKYGRHTFRRFDLIHANPGESTTIAQRHLDFYAASTNRIDSLAPVVTADTLPDLLPLQVLWRIAVRRRAEGFQIVAELQIEAIHEQVTATEWTIDLATFSADALFDWGRWDIDLWDSGLWGY